MQLCGFYTLTQANILILSDERAAAVIDTDQLVVACLERLASTLALSPDLLLVFKLTSWLMIANAT